MEINSIINNFGRIFILNVFTYLVYIKISNYNDNNKIKMSILVINNILISSIYVLMVTYIKPIFVIPIIYIMLGITIKEIVKHPFNYCITVVIIALIITYMIYLTSVLISGMILKLLIPNLNYDNPVSLLTIPAIMIVIYYTMQKTKRLKNGLNFLNNVERVEKVGKIVNIMLLLTIIIFGLLQDPENTLLNTFLVIGTFLTLYCTINWIQLSITKHYKKNMRDRTISVQKAEIDEQTKLLEEVEAENLKLATAVHKYNHRLSSLELAMKSAISHNLNTEFADELSVMLKDTEDLSNSFAKECDVAKCILPLTNVPSIDNMFKYMQDEASKCNINFDLKINESINDLIDNIILKDMFETLLGDHLRDAIIAVNASDNSYKSILTTLGLVDGCYELSIYDTGIEFQIDTLLKLGKEQVTTHKDSGGSGIGFMTTFETLKTTKASLVIEEYNPETTNYTKSVSIRFDGKNQYRIYSYRADDIKKQNKEKRIIIKNIE